MKNIKSFDEIKVNNSGVNESEHHINEGINLPEKLKVITDYYTLIFKADPDNVKSFLSAKFNTEITKGELIATELLNGLAHAYEAVPGSFDKPGLSRGSTIKADMQAILKFGGLG